MYDIRKMETEVLFCLIQLLLCLITSSADTTGTSELNFRLSKEDYTGLINRIEYLESRYEIYEEDKVTCQGYYNALIDVKDKNNQLSQEIMSLKFNHDKQQELEADVLQLDRKVTHLQGEVRSLISLDLSQIRGQKGEKGEGGSQGIKGERGTQGVKGEHGFKGTKGERGRKGKRGFPGTKGDNGLPGLDGQKGDRGEIDETVITDLQTIKTQMYRYQTALDNMDVDVNRIDTNYNLTLDIMESSLLKLKTEFDKLALKNNATVLELRQNLLNSSLQIQDTRDQLNHSMQVVDITFLNLTDSVNELRKTKMPLFSVKVLPSITHASVSNSTELRCVVKGLVSRTFQWFQDGTALEGKTNEYINPKPTATTTVSHKYKCEAFTPSGILTSDEATVFFIPTDCLEIYKSNIRTNGIYRISPDNITIINVFCDMEAGGWTVIQQRIHGDVNFARGWNDYVNGFGDLNGDFWLGLYYIHKLTNPPAEVIIEAVTRDTNESVWERFNRFTVGGATTNYTMHVNVTGTYNSVAQRLKYDHYNGFGFHNGAQFSTYDRKDKRNCVSTYGNGGGWWYRGCWIVSLNNQYNQLSRVVAIKRSKMKIRRN